MATVMTKEELMAKVAELEEKNAKLEAAAEAANKPEPVNNDPNRRVTIELFKDNDKYSQPLAVSVNNYSALIQRGVPVEIPYFVYKHLMEIKAQDTATAMMIGKLTTEWNEKSRMMK